MCTKSAPAERQPRAEKTGKGGPAAGRVGAPLPAKPCISVTRRQHFALRRLCPSAKLAPHCRQSLVPPLRGANILPWSAAGHRQSWRPNAGKAMYIRYEAPTFRPEAPLPVGKVGAPMPAKPCISVTRRQRFALRRRCRPAKLAPHCRQNLMPPLQDANILPWPSSRPQKNNKKTSNFSCSSVVRDQGFEPWTP